MISPKHANFIENAGGATTADCLALMAEARRRAREQYGVELEHEVVLLGDIAVPDEPPASAGAGELAPSAQVVGVMKSRRPSPGQRLASGGGAASAGDAARSRRRCGTVRAAAASALVVAFDPCST